MSERDQALIGILERLASEMEQQDSMLEDSLKRQAELAKSLDSAERHLRRKQIDAEKAQEKLSDSFHHYRSDMLSLVNEQDRINRNIDDLQKAIKTAAYTLDATNQKITGLDERLKQHEKTSQEHFEHALKQPGVFREVLDDSNRNFTRLHADTEKHLGELHRETARQLDKFQHETMRRLLLLDGIITSLQTLLVRTEPPEKKPLWIVRQFSKIAKFFRFKVLFAK